MVAVFASSLFLLLDLLQESKSFGVQKNAVKIWVNQLGVFPFPMIEEHY
jgi:hypothetical protein